MKAAPGVKQPPTLLDAALYYASIGWRVFPLSDESKVPITGHGYLDATLDADQIRAWWTSCPTARIGISLRPSGLIAVDVDVGEGRRGAEVLAALEAQHGPLPRTCHQRSGRGGEHIVMRDPSPGPDGWTRPQKIGGACRGNLGANVDVKCNGYIVAEPSGSYKWLALDPAHVPAMPEAWVALLRKPDAPAAPAAGPDVWATSVAPLDEEHARSLRAELAALGPRGSGSNTTFKAVMRVHHDYGQSVVDGRPYLDEWNAQCGKPHSAAELDRQVGKLWKEAQGPRGSALRGADRVKILEILEIRGAAPVVAPTVEEVAARPRPPIRSYPSGMPGLDDLIGGGLSTRQLTTLLGPPGAGKSALAVAMAVHLGPTVPVLYASTELESDELSARVAANILGVPWTDVVRGRVEIGSCLAGHRIHVIGCEDLPRGEAAITYVRASAAALADARCLPPVVILDYLQDLARGSKDGDVRGRVGDIAGRFRALAQELDCAVIAVSSVSRAYYGAQRQTEGISDDPTYYLAAAKESGDVDYASAVVAFLDVDQENEKDAASRLARIAVAKSRHGRAGFIGARFHGASGRWSIAPEALALMSSAARKSRAEQSKYSSHEEHILEAVRSQPMTWGEVRSKVTGNNTELARARDRLLLSGALVRALETRTDENHRTKDLVLLKART